MNYRESRAYLNCEKRIYASDHPMGFPRLLPCEINLQEPFEMLGFNYALTEKRPQDKILHFFVDDYQFERVWNDPNKYLPVLERFKAVVMPDFSTYTDFPKVVQMFNHYRNLWLARYWQENGITVIPNINFSDEQSFEWVFDSIPQHSAVCLSTVGCWLQKEAKRLWLLGYEQMLKRVQPKKILLYGKQFPEIQFDGELVVGRPMNLVNREKNSDRGKPNADSADR